MIGRVKQHVHQYIFNAARPGFALAVAVFDFVVERPGRELIYDSREIFCHADDISSASAMQSSIVELGHTGMLWALPEDAFEPELLRRKNVRHAPDGVGGDGSAARIASRHSRFAQ